MGFVSVKIPGEQEKEVLEIEAFFIFFSMLAVLSIICFVVYRKGLVDEYTRDLRGLLVQAREVRDDLNQFMEKSWELSEQIVSRLEQSATITADSSLPNAINEPGDSAAPAEDDILAEVSIENGDLSYVETMVQESTLSAPETEAAVIAEAASESNLESDPAAGEEEEPDQETLQSMHPYLAVKTLRDRGYGVKEIAVTLNRGQGEVALILNLLEKKRALS